MRRHVRLVALAVVLTVSTSCKRPEASADTPQQFFGCSAEPAHPTATRTATVRRDDVEILITGPLEWHPFTVAVIEKRVRRRWEVVGWTVPRTTAGRADEIFPKSDQPALATLRTPNANGTRRFTRPSESGWYRMCTQSLDYDPRTAARTTASLLVEFEIHKD